MLSPRRLTRALGRYARALTEAQRRTAIALGLCAVIPVALELSVYALLVMVLDSGPLDWPLLHIGLCCALALALGATTRYLLDRHRERWAEALSLGFGAAALTRLAGHIDLPAATERQSLYRIIRTDAFHLSRIGHRMVGLALPTLAACGFATLAGMLNPLATLALIPLALALLAFQLRLMRVSAELTAELEAIAPAANAVLAPALRSREQAQSAAQDPIWARLYAGYRRIFLMDGKALLATSLLSALALALVFALALPTEATSPALASLVIYLAVLRALAQHGADLAQGAIYVARYLPAIERYFGWVDQGQLPTGVDEVSAMAEAEST